MSGFDVQALVVEYGALRPQEADRPWDKRLLCSTLHMHAAKLHETFMSQGLRREAYLRSMAEIGLVLIDHAISSHIDIDKELLTGQEEQPVPQTVVEGILGLHARIQDMLRADTDVPGMVDLFSYLLLFGQTLKLDIEKEMHAILRHGSAAVGRTGPEG